MSFLQNLAKEIGANGKLLTGYALYQSILSSNPGVITAVKTAIADRTPASFIDLGIQGLMLVGALLKAKKIVTVAAIKSADASQ